MGSPIFPIIAIIYMEHLEQRALGTSSFAPRLWKRYVDDVFAIIQSRHLTKFLEHLISQTQGIIRFTHEVEEDHSLSFLDVLVHQSEEGKLDTGVYMKPTRTNQLLNFESHYPVSAKISVIRSLIRKSHLVPSLTAFKKEEL